MHGRAKRAASYAYELTAAVKLSVTLHDILYTWMLLLFNESYTTLSGA